MTARTSLTHLAIALLLGAPAATAADLPADTAATAAELRARALADTEAHELLRQLTVQVGPRFAGTPGDAAAVAWAERTMRRLGLANVRLEPVTVPRWVRGAAAGEIVSPYPQALHLLALGGSVGTPAQGITAPVVEVVSLEDLAARPEEDIRGRIVFFNQRMERRQDGAGYGRTVGIRSRGPARAAEKGAVAVLIRSVGTGNHRFPHTGGTRYAEGGERIPAAALAIPDADILEAQIAGLSGGDDPVVFRLLLGSRYEGEALSHNVIGEVVGREKPEEIVLLGAHLDSWDVGSGAIDDGSGCVVVLRAAELVAGLETPPRRTLRVVLFANEEFGLSGARAYAEAHADELDRHHLAMESDFGAGRVWRYAVAVHPDGVGVAANFHPLLEPLGIAWHGNTGRGGADLSPLRRARVPVADLTQDGTHYFDYHHTDDDTFDKVEPAALAQNLAAYTVLAFLAAEVDPAPFSPGPEPPARRR